MKKYDKFIVGFIVGIVLASAVTAWAAGRFVLANGSSVEIGTSTNPLIVQT